VIVGLNGCAGGYISLSGSADKNLTKSFRWRCKISFPKPFNLSGKVALVTGAASGLGVAFAEAMAEAGADVVCADINNKGLQKTVKKIEKIGKIGLAVICDVSKEEDVKRMMRVTVNTLGRLDILFNNAGIGGVRKPLHKYTTEEWDQILAVDLQGVFFCAREALKIMVKQKSGKIINIASIWGLVGSSSIMPVPAYNAAKGAVVNLTRELGLEYSAKGINVNVICPGFYRTNLGGGKSYNPKFIKAVKRFVPMGKMAGPEDLKGTAIYLASSASDYMCGQMIVTDGGILAK
jgi:NAD(P)-dependent dehydrogenase (short-subunit alcohol dehydrogenase family)